MAVFIFFGLDFGREANSIEAAIPGKNLPVSAAVGSTAPDFELNTLSGETVKLSDLRGKIVILNFWATWCEPCKFEMPFFEKLYQDNISKIEILGINFDEPQHQVQQFVDELGISFPILLDPGAEVQDLYRIRGYPTTFIVDQLGVTSFHHIGLITEEQVYDYLSELGASK